MKTWRSQIGSPFPQCEYTECVALICQGKWESPLCISLHRAPWWVGSTVSELSKIPIDTKQNQNPSEKLKIKAYPLNSLNLSKGVVRSPDLSLCILDEIKSNLCKQGVTDTKQISIKRNNQIILTNTYILNFNSPKLLQFI